MAFDKEKAIKITEETIQYGLRHKDYAESVEIARKSKIFVTGEGQDTEYLVNLRDKESDRQKELRVKVTNPITSFALNPVKTQYEKIWRVDGVRVDISHKDAKLLSMVNDAVETYHSNSNITEYFRRRFLHYQFLDPNAWHMTERRNVYDEAGKIEKVDVYPFEVTSEQAINYKYDNGVPVWLIVEQKRLEVVRETNNGKADVTEKEVSDFYFYANGTSLLYREFVNEPPEDGAPVVILFQNEDESRKFAFYSFDTGSEEFPGQKFGAYDDPSGDGTLKVPPFWTGARYLLEDLIGKKSSFDVSVYGHVFPKLFHYDEKCKYQAPNGGATCEGGYLEGNKKHVCPSCNGTGGSIHLSELDIVTFDIPQNMEDLSKLPPLSGLAYYHQPPLDVTEAIYGWIKDLLEQVYMASFNTSNVDRALVSKTATEITGIWDEVNTRVYPCAAWMSRLFEKTVRVAAQYLGAGKDLSVNHTVPMDMKLEPLDVLIDRFQRAKNAGLSYDARWSIHCDILGKTFIDAPSVVEDIKAWENWKPFKSMDQETIALILQNRSFDDFDRLLYENWDSVKLEVESQLDGKVMFSELEKSKQFEQVKKAVDKVGDSIKTEAPEPIGMPDFTANPEPEPILQ